MTTRRMTKGELFSIGGLAATLGVAATLGTGFIAWGGLRNQVSSSAAQIQKLEDGKADKEMVRDGFSGTQTEIRRLADRIDRVLERENR